MLFQTVLILVTQGYCAIQYNESNHKFFTKLPAFYEARLFI